MASIRVTSMDTFTDVNGTTLVLVNPDDTPRPINYWSVPRWWGSQERTIYEHCARVDDLANNKKILATYEVSDTKKFKNIIASGQRYTDRNKDFTVKVDVSIPRNFRGKQIFYRFKAEGVSSEIGATTTLPQIASNFKIAIFS